MLIFETSSAQHKSPDEIFGDLFVHVQISKIFGDSKTFTDCVPKIPAEEILQRYHAIKNSEGFDLKNFVLENFLLPDQSHSKYIADTTMTITQHIEEVDPLISCVTAKDGQEAMNLISNDEHFIPDFIFLDLNMPRMSGKEFLVAVRKLERMKDVLIYVYTTSAALKDKEEVMTLSANGFITKPYTINKLKEILSELLTD